MGQLLKNTIPTWQVYLLLWVAVACIYWPVTWAIHPLVWDKLDTSLPWLSLLSDTLRSGQFPYWNPYQSMGYPLYADLQTPIWNPLILLMVTVFPFEYYTLHLIDIVHLSLGAMGMYHVLRLQNVAQRQAIIWAIVYAGCGYFIGRGQNLISTTGGAWMPWAFWGCMRWLKNPNFHTAVTAAIALFLQISGGYQALTVILFYFLIGAFGVQWASEKWNISYLKQILVSVPAFILPVTLMSVLIGYIVLYEFPLSARPASLPLSTVLFGELPPKAVISLIMPYPTITDQEYWGSDVSLRNMFIGIMACIGIVFQLLSKKWDRWDSYFIGFGLFALLASFGVYTPVRTWLYQYVPLLNSFRFPYFFVWFFIAPVLLISAKGWTHFWQAYVSPKQAKWVIGVSMGIVFICIAKAARWIDLEAFYLFKSFSFPSILTQGSRLAYQFLQGCIVLVLLSIALAALQFKRFTPALITLLILIEVSVSALFTMGGTYVDYTQNTTHLKAFVQLRNREFTPIQNLTMLQFAQQSQAPSPLWRNVSNFNRVPAYDGFTSFTLQTSDTLADHPAQLQRVLKKFPVIYAGTQTTPLADSNLLHAPVPIYMPDSASKIEISQFSPSGFTFTIQQPQAAMSVIQQSYSPHWQAFIDKKPVSIAQIHLGQMGIPVPAGLHTISIHYRSSAPFWCLVISMASFGISCVLAIVTRRKLSA